MKTSKLGWVLIGIMIASGVSIILTLSGLDLTDSYHVQFITLIAAILLFYFLRWQAKQKSIRFRRKMNSARTLEEAIERAFDYLPLGSTYIGPLGRLSLSRNELPKGHDYVAEVSVMDIVAKDGKILFCAGWSKDDTNYHLRSNWDAKIEEWSRRW